MKCIECAEAIPTRRAEAVAKLKLAEICIACAEQRDRDLIRQTRRTFGAQLILDENAGDLYREFTCE